MEKPKDFVLVPSHRYILKEPLPGADTGQAALLPQVACRTDRQHAARYSLDDILSICPSATRCDEALLPWRWWEVHEFLAIQGIKE